jgi:hypothetical protein
MLNPASSVCQGAASRALDDRRKAAISLRLMRLDLNFAVQGITLRANSDLDRRKIVRWCLA